MPRVLILVVVLLVATCWKARADQPQLPPGVTCELVRSKVAEHGRYVAWAWARLQGYSKAEIDQAKRCLK